MLEDRDVLVLDDGRHAEIVAADEKLLEIRGRDPVHLAGLAWHIGNRHLAAAIEAERILILRDHVISAMLEGLGAVVREIVEPFNPLGGAYSSGAQGKPGGHGHAHHGDDQIMGMTATTTVITIARRTTRARHAHGGTGIVTALTSGGLIRLQAWLSPAFPVGSFSYSHGLESAVDAGLVADAASLRKWLARPGRLRFGLERCGFVCRGMAARIGGRRSRRHWPTSARRSPDRANAIPKPCCKVRHFVPLP